MNSFLRFPITVVLTLLLASCSSSNKFYQHDGPPSSGSFFNQTASAKPKVETFKSSSLRPYTVMGKRYVPIKDDIPMEQTGIASWYGKQFHGHKTSIGETYDMHAMSAAHPTMPLPSYAIVTNLSNGKSITVRVNDRGPFLNNRVIDLSYAAANALGYADKGTAKVHIRRLTNSEIATNSWKSTKEASIKDIQETLTSQSSPQLVMSPSSFGWGIQVGFFSDLTNAQKYASHTEAIISSNNILLPVRILEENNGYRVVCGKEMGDQIARQTATTIQRLLGTEAFIIQK